MSKGVVPLLSAKGIYRLKAPFDAQLLANTSYECVALREMVDLLSTGTDVYAQYYEPYGLTEQEYQQDVTDGVVMCSLRTDGGIWLYVPSSYVLSFPGMSGVKYGVMLLGVMLGSIPETLDLTYLKSQIEQMVSSELGITSAVEEVIVSQIDILSKDEHLRLEAARKAKISAMSNAYTKSKKLETLNTQLMAKNEQLSQYILDHQP